MGIPDGTYDPYEAIVEASASGEIKALIERYSTKALVDDIPSKKVELPSQAAKKVKRFHRFSQRLFERLAILPGKKGMVIYLALLQYFRIYGEPVPLSNVRLSPYGISKNVKNRDLKHLEEAGLVRVERRENRNPLVWLLDKDRGGKP
jgi:hypothetical protein